MTVYVDDMMLPARVRPDDGKGMEHVAKWSHLMADTPVELDEFAAKLGLQHRWIQHAGTHREHFDVTMRTRQRAFVLGAVHLSFPQGLADLLAERRKVCGCKTLANCTWAVLMGGSPHREEPE